VLFSQYNLLSLTN